MGVKLKDIIVRNSIEVSELAGSVIAIDAPNIIMSLFNFARKNPDGSYAGLLMDQTHRPISHLYGLLYRINFLYSNLIFPVFCLDGKVSDLKRLIPKDQLKDFLFMQKWYHSTMESGEIEFAKAIASNREYQWQTIIKESKELLSALGVPYIDSPSSAESQCAQLVKDEIAHFSNSQDFDSLVFGCPHLLQNLSKTLRRKVQGKWVYQKITPARIDLTHNLHDLGIDQFQLVDMTILIGCDYFPGIKSVGPKRALKLLKSYKRIEKVIPQEKFKYNFESLTPELIAQVRKIFLLPNVIETDTEFSWDMPNESLVKHLLCEAHFLEKKRVENNLKKLVLNFDKCRTYFINRKGRPPKLQITLDQYR
jgi:flap endonuclease-1